MNLTIESVLCTIWQKQSHRPGADPDKFWRVDWAPMRSLWMGSHVVSFSALGLCIAQAKHGGRGLPEVHLVIGG